MKELSIEQKAKRYDEILARAKGTDIPYYKADIMSKVKEFVDYLLPELAESEDESVRKELIKYFKKYQALSLGDYNVQDILVWLEKQREQKPAEWSEEDNVNLNYIIKVLGRLYDRNDKAYLQESLERKINWLKSLRPQSHWKPSEEQMFDLKCAADSNSNVLLGQSLLSLYNDLKKVTE